MAPLPIPRESVSAISSSPLLPAFHLPFPRPSPGPLSTLVPSKSALSLVLKDVAYPGSVGVLQGFVIALPERGEGDGDNETLKEDDMKMEIAAGGNGSRMKLLTNEILAAAPRLYANERKQSEDVPVVAKFFNPCGAGTWYMTEYDPDEKLAFGLCVIQEPELGYFSLEDLESIELQWGMGIERDLLWQGTLADAERIEHVSR